MLSWRKWYSAAPLEMPQGAGALVIVNVTGLQIGDGYVTVTYLLQGDCEIGKL